MDTLMEILEDVQPDVDFESCDTLIDDGMLDSFAILSIVSELEDQFEISVSPADIIPENFNSAQAIWAMVQRLQGEAAKAENRYVTDFNEICAFHRHCCWGILSDSKESTMGLAPCGQLRILPVCRGRRCWIFCCFPQQFPSWQRCGWKACQKRMRKKR